MSSMAPCIYFNLVNWIISIHTYFFFEEKRFIFYVQYFYYWVVQVILISSGLLCLSEKCNGFTKPNAWRLYTSKMFLKSETDGDELSKKRKILQITSMNYEEHYKFTATNVAKLRENRKTPTAVIEIS